MLPDGTLLHVVCCWLAVAIPYLLLQSGILKQVSEVCSSHCSPLSEWECIFGDSFGILKGGIILSVTKIFKSILAIQQISWQVQNKTKEGWRAVFSSYIFLLLPAHIPRVIRGRLKATFGKSWCHLQVYHLQTWPGLAFLLHGLRDAQETARQA